jgi:tetratricopeptide (TPR) repeat protein
MKQRLLATLLVILPAAANAQSDSQWVGTKVVVKRDTPLRVGTKDVVDREGFTVYEVQKVNGDWLWLVSDLRQGWVHTKNVIPYSKAIDQITRELKGHPNAQAYLSRGKLWEARSEFDKAIADYSAAIKLDPTNEFIYNSRGNAWRSKGEYDKAIADHSEAIRLDPKYALAYNNRGTAWQYKQDEDKALADYNEAIRLDPNDGAAYTNRGFILRDRGEYDGAVADLDNAIRLEPNDAVAYYHRGLVWRDKGEYGKAIADYSEAIRINPEFDVAYNSRGNARRLNRQFDKALADYNEATRLEPGKPNSYNDRAWLWATCPDRKYRDGKRAVASARKACELSGWKNPYFFDALAAAYAEAGDFKKAVEWQEKAMKSGADGEVTKAGAEQLKLYKARKPYRENLDK